MVKKLDRRLYPLRLFLPYVGLGMASTAVFLLLLNAAVVRWALAAVIAAAMLGLLYKKREVLI